MTTENKDQPTPAGSGPESPSPAETRKPPGSRRLIGALRLPEHLLKDDLSDADKEARLQLIRDWLDELSGGEMLFKPEDFER
jgi:hypothetical protein